MVSLPKLTQLRSDRAKIPTVHLDVYPGFASPRGPGQHLTLLVCSPSLQANVLPSPVEDASVFSSRIYPPHWVSC